MPLLDQNGVRADIWVRDVSAPFAITSLVELPQALAARQSGQKLGLAVSNSTKLAEILPYLDELGLVVIAFPSFSDGRGFSLAKQLRLAHFTGVIRAFGPLIPDQFAYALACGFDELEISDEHLLRQPGAQWAAALTQVTGVYQRDNNTGVSILDQRRVARKTGVA